MSTRLIALIPIPSSVGTIPAGTEFIVPRKEQAEELVRLKHAQYAPEPQAVEAVTVPPIPPVIKTAVVVGSGPSLTGEDLTATHRWRNQDPNRRFIIVVNRTHELAPWADHLYAADPNFWLYHGERIAESFKGERWTSDAKVAQRWKAVQVKVQDKPGLSKEPGTLNSGGNSGHQAINLAYHLGAKRIVLLGFDMQVGQEGQTHWHGDYEEPQLRQSSPYQSWGRRFKLLAAGLERSGVKTLNASRQTALECFQRAALENALDGDDPVWAS